MSLVNSMLDKLEINQWFSKPLDVYTVLCYQRILTNISKLPLKLIYYQVNYFKIKFLHQNSQQNRKKNQLTRKN